jgi:apolipoprotein D and lipocalin family protein
MVKNFGALFFLLFFAGCSFGRVDKPAVVSDVNLSKYSGLWFEISRYPVWFQSDCIGATAEYQKLDSKRLSLINTCLQKEGTTRSIAGTARVVDSQEPAKLKVRFDTFWGRFFEGDYWIVLLSEDYRYVAVSGPGKRMLWILARSPALDELTYKKILDELKRMGFDIERLKRSHSYIS